MLKRMFVVGALAVVSGCGCLPCLPALPKCWLCAIGDSLSATLFGPSSSVGRYITNMIDGFLSPTS